MKQNALHWASKHGNSDVVKLIAGTYKADVNERTVSFVHSDEFYLGTLFDKVTKRKTSKNGISDYC